MTDINAQRGQHSYQITDVISKVPGVECVGVLRCPQFLGVPSVPTGNQTVYAFNSPSFASRLEHLIANDGYEKVSDSVERLPTSTDQTPVCSQPCTRDIHLTSPEQQPTAKYSPSPSEQLAPFEETFRIEQAKIRCDSDQVNESNSSEKSRSLNQNDETTKSVPVENHEYLPNNMNNETVEVGEKITEGEKRQQDTCLNDMMSLMEIDNMTGTGCLELEGGPENLECNHENLTSDSVLQNLNGVEDIKIEDNVKAVERANIFVSEADSNQNHCDDNKDNIPKIEVVDHEGSNISTFKWFEVGEMEFPIEDFQLPRSEFQLEKDIRTKPRQKDKRLPKDKKIHGASKGKSSFHTNRWKKYIVKEQCTRQGKRVKWRFVKGSGKGLKEDISAHPGKHLGSEGNSSFKLVSAELTRKEKKSSVWKCFAKKAIKTGPEKDGRDVGFVAKCQMCDFMCDYFEGSSINQMVKHLKEMHSVDATKIKIYPKEEEMMEEKIKTSKLTSSVWKFFVFGDEKEGERPTLTLCTLCGFSLPYCLDGRTSDMHNHLKTVHKVARDIKDRRSLSQVVNLRPRKVISNTLKNLRPRRTAPSYTLKGTQEPKSSNVVWKYFVKKEVKNANEPSESYTVTCQLCKRKYGKSSVQMMEKHLVDKHKVQLSKAIVCSKDEKIMQEKTKKLGLKSYVWKYFVLKKRNVRSKPSSLLCALCGFNIPLHKDSSSKMRTHLRSSHSVVRPTKQQNRKIRAKNDKPSSMTTQESDEERLVWKCFVEIGEDSYAAKCQLCECRFLFIGKSSMNYMVKHLKDMHDVDATKVKLDPQDEEIMKEKINKQRSISVVWKFFVLKEGNGDQEAAVTKCILCGTLVPYPDDKSTSKMRCHLQSCHNMELPSTARFDHDCKRSLVSCLN